jgi:pilus assembly protein CpaC
MFKSPWRLIVLSVLTTFAASSADSLFAQDTGALPVNNDPVFKVASSQSELKIVEKFAKIIEMPTRITTVFGFDPEVIKVTKVEYYPSQFRVHAVSPGVTSLVLVDEKNETYTIEIFVTGDVRHLQAYINRLFPNASVTAVAVRDSVVLRGWVTRPEHITRLVEIAEQFHRKVLNQMEVGGVQTISLKVKIVEVQRSKIRKFGLTSCTGTAKISWPACREIWFLWRLCPVLWRRPRLSRPFWAALFATIRASTRSWKRSRMSRC